MSGRVDVGTPYTIAVVARDGSASLYPLATIRNAASATVATVSLSHIADGLYTGQHTFSAVGRYTVHAVPYIDAGHTQKSVAYDSGGETVEVSNSLPTQVLDALVLSHLNSGSVGEALAIIRGMVQQNYVLDNTTHNAKGLLLSGRMRIFANASDATTETSPIAEYTITTTPKTAPDDDLEAKYKVVKV